MREDAEARARRLIELSAFQALAPEHRAIVAAAGEAPEEPCPDPEAEAGFAALAPLGDDGYEVVASLVSRGAFDRLRPVHQRALVGIVEARLSGDPAPVLCFSPGTAQETVEAFNAATFAPIGVRFQPGQRWSRTATNTGTLVQGDPVTITYSFVPDGTIVPNLAGQQVSSNLFAFLNGVYGSPAAWQPIYAQVFERWGQLCGITYVYEPRDDGVAMNAYNSGGVRGVRGDVRLAGAPLDGNYGVLAFNYFPNSGDMVLDTADAFYVGAAALQNASLRLRNVLAHEHGHGMGMNHVCPLSQTKLMEPYASTAFDGPQLDDVLLAQRFYGDGFEPNDTPGAATPLSPPVAGATTVPSVSIDDNSDTDVYAVTVAVPGQLEVTLRPTGASYLNGPQNGDGSCSAGAPFDALRQHDLRVRVSGPDGAALLADGNSTGVGEAEQATAQLATAGTYYITVSGAATDNIQAYELDYRLSAQASLAITLPDGPPAELSTRAATGFDVRVQAFSQILTGAPVLNYRTGDGPVQTAALTARGGDLYTARLPAGECGASVSFWITAAGAITGAARLPLDPAASYTVEVHDAVTLFSDGFETDLGWTAGVPTDTATSGQWVRADPNGTIAKPEDGFAGAGTRCFFTGQAPAGTSAGDADVDGGSTTLLSPRLDLSGYADARVSYARWYSNSAGAGAGADVFRVDVSADDGATWVNAETVGPTGTGTSGGWVQTSFSVRRFVTPTGRVRVRFVAEDTGAASLIEAAVDEFAVTADACDARPATGCHADFDRAEGVQVADIFAFLRAWFANVPSADFDQQNGIQVADIFAFLRAWFAGC